MCCGKEDDFKRNVVLKKRVDIVRYKTEKGEKDKYVSKIIKNLEKVLTKSGRCGKIYESQAKTLETRSDD